MESVAFNNPAADKDPLSHLPAFASFILEHHFADYISLQLQLIRQQNLPLMRFFEGYSDDQLLEIGRKGANELLNALIGRETDAYIQSSKDLWLANSLPYMIRKEAIVADDIIILSSIRKKALSSFLPLYTTDITVVQHIHQDLDDFLSGFNLSLIDALTKVLSDKIKGEAQIKENEERLRLAVESTQLGTWDYNILTGEYVVSDRCREILGLASTSGIAFDEFLEHLHPDDRESVSTLISDYVQKKVDDTHYEREYRMYGIDDGRLRWVRANGEVLLNQQGEPHRFIGTLLDITDRKRTEALLIENEHKFRQLADSMPQMVWITLADGIVTYFNKQWVDYTGTTVDATDNKWSSSLHPEDVGKSRKTWERSLETGEPFQIEYRLRHKETGVYRWFLVRALPVKNAEGRIIKWFGTCTDIQDQKLAEESLKMQARVLESMEEGVSISDEAGYIIYTNPAEDRMFGYEEGELVGKHVTAQNAYPKDENKRIVRAVMEELKARGQWNGEWHNIRKDKTTFYTYSHITELITGDKRLLVCVQRDITAEKKAQEALLESEQRFRTLADQAPMFVWMSDEQANLTYYNKEIQEYVGGSKEKFLQTGWSLITHPEDVARLYDIYARASNGAAPFEAECRLKNVYGHYRWFLFKGVPRYDGGRFAGFIGTGIDVEDQKKLTLELERKVDERTKDLSESNNKLERSNQELEQFAYVASHDLQEPLRKIKAFGDILVGRYKQLLGADGADMIDRMQSAADRMRALIEDLLSYSRVSRQANPKEIDLNGLLKEVIYDLDTSIRDRKAKIDMDDLPALYGDELQLRQMFQNLISNALKFSKPDVEPEISIRTGTVTGRDSGVQVSSADLYKTFHRIEVADNGIGFEQQYADKIFQVFQRLHGRMDYPGSGVGLSIVQKVVENHMGYVRASGEPGKGSRFTILLPVVKL